MGKLRRYYSKILLFGEYAVIHGSPALAIPCQKFFGQFSKEKIEYDLQEFWDYVKTLKFEHTSLNIEKLEQDIKEGISFETNIAIGYGLGSSGALCAAVFDRYFENTIRLEIHVLKNILAQIESFFHGQSSGMDPLVSFLQSGILKHKNGNMELINKSSKKWKFYLVDTGIPRSTEPLVKLYMEKYKDKSYQNEVNQLIVLNKICIENYLKDSEDLGENFSKLSKLESVLFNDMIPENMKEIYGQKGLKLCGAGGGGYFLGLCKKEETPSIEEFPLIIID